MHAMALPVGPAVTFLFTDIEGSTRLERSVGTAAWSRIVGDHEEDPVQTERIPHVDGGHEVTHVDRVERAPEHAQSLRHRYCLADVG